MDLDLIIYCFVREQYEDKYDENVPVALKGLMVHFSKSLKLLNVSEEDVFSKWMECKLSKRIIPSTFKWLYTASEHNDVSASFHEKCDNQGPTVVVIQSNYGHIFGGYTSIDWTTSGDWEDDKDAFLFLIRSNDALQESSVSFTKPCSVFGNEFAVYHDSNGGPAFGGSWDHKGHDIMIGDGDKGCYTAKCIYNHKNALCGAEEDEDGFCYFKIVDFEVFAIV